MVRKKVDKIVRIPRSIKDPAKPLATKSGASSKALNAEGCGSSEDVASEVSKREKIALLAYTYWEQRGHRGGSPEEDWYRAEREIGLGLQGV